MLALFYSTRTIYTAKHQNSRKESHSCMFFSIVASPRIACKHPMSAHELIWGIKNALETCERALAEHPSTLYDFAFSPNERQPPEPAMVPGAGFF